MDVAHLFMHSPVDGQLGCFGLLAVVNDAAMNTSIWSPVLNEAGHWHFSNL